MDIDELKRMQADAVEALDNMDDYARMECGVDPIGPRGVLERYIEQTTAALETLRAELERKDTRIKRVTGCWEDAEKECKELRAELEEVRIERDSFLSFVRNVAEYDPAVTTSALPIMYARQEIMALEYVRRNKHRQQQG